MDCFCRPAARVHCLYDRAGPGSHFATGKDTLHVSPHCGGTDLNDLARSEIELGLNFAKILKGIIPLLAKRCHDCIAVPHKPGRLHDYRMPDPFFIRFAQDRSCHFHLQPAFLAGEAHRHGHKEELDPLVLSLFNIPLLGRHLHPGPVIDHHYISGPKPSCTAAGLNGDFAAANDQHLVAQSQYLAGFNLT